MFSNILFQLSIPFPFGMSEQQLGAGDFNGDGITDFVVPFINGTTGGTPIAPRFFLGDASGGFSDGTAALFGAGGAAGADYGARMAVADFNGDGRADVLLIDSGLDAPPFPGGLNELYLSAPGGKMINAPGNLPNLQLFGHGVTAGDLDKDGDVDAVVFNINRSDGSAMQVLLNDGHGVLAWQKTFSPVSYQASGFNIGDLSGALADLDGDGDLDLIVGANDETSHPSAVYLNDGRGDFSKSSLIELPRTGVLKAAVVEVEPFDLNGDGRADLIISATSGAYGTSDFYTVPYLQVLIGEGGGRFQDETELRLPQSLTAPAQPAWIKWVDAVDLDRDGAKDLIVSYGPNGQANQTLIYLNDGAGRFALLPDQMRGWVTPLSGADGAVKSFAVMSYDGLRVIANDIPKFAVSGGADSVSGSTAGDVIATYRGDDSISAGAGNDTIDGGWGTDTVSAGAGDDSINDPGGANVLQGDEGNDQIQGGLDFDRINGNMGNDTAYGGEGGDWVVGGKDNDLLYGETGADVVNGNLGNDTCYGGADADWVRGGQGDDLLDGGAGNDWMAGDRGNDSVTGGAGADIFYFFAGAAMDRVTDFSAASGDRVLLDSGQAYSLSFTGEGAVVSLGAGDQMILVGVNEATLGAWLFV